MKKYKVTVYAICKNEEQNILKWYNSMKEADEIVVLDTGSTDNTIKLIQKNCPKIKLYQDTKYYETINKRMGGNGFGNTGSD